MIALLAAVGAVAAGAAGIPLCVADDGPAPGAVARAVRWWGAHGVEFDVLAPGEGIPGLTCVAVFVSADLLDGGLRGVTVFDPRYAPVVGLARRHDAIALAHELGHVAYGVAHDPRPHRILSAGPDHPRWRL